jgi:hypothetical protein
MIPGVPYKLWNLYGDFAATLRAVKSGEMNNVTLANIKVRENSWCSDPSGHVGGVVDATPPPHATRAGVGVESESNPLHLDVLRPSMQVKW